jgi:hypothetical protein
MNLRLSTIFLCLGLLTMSLASSRQAYATLGEGADSIAKDRKALSAIKRATTSRANYTVQEVASDATTVREYLTPSGIVFAVAWNGLVHPDLTALLGSYANEFQNAKRRLPRKHGQKRTQVKADRVVVETWGHMRNLQGRAYVPELVPAGVNLDEIH